MIRLAAVALLAATASASGHETRSLQAAQPQCLSPEWHFDYPGNDLSMELAPTLDACCSTCSKNNACHAYTWTKYLGGACYMKTKKSSSVWQGAQPDGSAYFISQEVYKCQALAQDRDLAGEELKNLPGPRAESCCALCRQTTNCTGFSWNNYNGGTCWLKKGQLLRTAVPNVISALV